nr:family 16 glycoside hydrolase [uncultured Flavobacterium sp.]
MKKLNIICMMLISLLTYSQKEQKLNLFKLIKTNQLRIINREVKVIDSLSNSYIKLSENKSEGIVWLPIKDFKNGTVKIEMRGKNVFQKSFIGIAFHGQDDKTYDAVYCRPFNFIAKDSIRRVHAIQYISHPIDTWKKLREEKNSLYEKEIVNPPNPDGWFTMTIVVDNKSVKAYINDAKKPALEVDKLNNNQNGKIGLFVGDDSGGDFSNIRIAN